MRERLVPGLALVAASLVVPAALIHWLGNPVVDAGWDFHFWFATVAMTGAIAAALTLSITGAKRGDARAVLVGTAFSVMAALFLIHGLATPGVILPENHEVATHVDEYRNGLLAFAGGATLPAGGFVLSLAGFPRLLRREAVPKLIALQAVLAGAVVLVGGLALAFHEEVPAEPDPDSPLAISVLAIGLGFFALVGWRALRTWTLTRRRDDLAIACGIALLAAALFAALTMESWTIGWWASHALEVAGIVLIGVPVARDLKRGAQSRALTGDLRGYELVRQEEEYLGPYVRSLMVDLAGKDEYTELHTRRVAHLAVRAGEHLGLPGHRLRALALGGLLHDIGKLSIPDEILKKPAALDDDEFALIRRHPDWGDQLAAELGLPERVRRLIRSHHERLDGAGYPDGRADLEEDVRILAACDVYDALISQRVYREAWTANEALEELRREVAAGKLDARAVEAIERVVDRPSGQYDVPPQLRAARPPRTA